MIRKISFWTLIALALIGLASSFITQPANMIRYVVSLIIIVSVALLATYLLRKKNNKQQLAYIRAARKSRKRFKKQPETKQYVKSHTKGIKKSRSKANLTVIEGKGKKNKKKNRAIY